jgi:hypothetical protein
MFVLWAEVLRGLRGPDVSLRFRLVDPAAAEDLQKRGARLTFVTYPMLAA